MRLLLGSGGTRGSQERFEVWKKRVNEFLADCESVLFVPYALSDWNGYTAAMKEMDVASGRHITGIHEHADTIGALALAEAVFVGGGNTFRLLNQLQERELLMPIKTRVVNGLPYIGISAGSNMACPTIKTTNDMPIVQPLSFEALALVPFQINPHYIDGGIFVQEEDAFVPHAGETRELRIAEFHEENDEPVLALREGEILRVEEGKAQLVGIRGGRLFRREEATEDLEEGAELTFLL